MRKDFILTEEELKVKRERLQHIRNPPTAIEPVTTATVASDSEVLSETLHDIDNVSLDGLEIFLRFVPLVDGGCEGDGRYSWGNLIGGGLVSHRAYSLRIFIRV